jgi:Domain of unknown function (DUF5916)
MRLPVPPATVDCPRRLLSIVCLTGLVLTAAAAAPAFAQQASPATRPRPAGTAGAVAEAPTLDGEVLNDPVWSSAPVITSFFQEQPAEGAPSSEKTEVRLVFTKDTLYIGAVMYDAEPGGIVTADPRRDASLDDVDSFRMLVDTYRDRQNGFVFGTSAAGGEYDGQVTNEGQGGGGIAFGGTSAAGSGGGFNINWDGAWTVRTKISEVGWTAEFAIPFKTLRFPGTPDQTWGVNFQRNIRRKNERAYWAPIPRQFNLYRVSLAGSVSGIRTPAVRNLKIMPYALGQTITSGVEPAPTDNSAEFGGDLKYSVTPALTLDATVNTDFAQVEVDDQQVNLDRFNLFFPEKRPFFLENAGFFSVGNQGEVDLFFSRRIGLSANGESVPIIAGGRMSGKAGKYNIGLLNMQTNDVDNRIASNNFAVARVSRDLPNRSQVGALITQRQATGDLAGTDDYGRTYALDGRWGIKQNTVVSGFFAKTDTPGRTGDDTAFNIRSRTNLQRIDVDAGYQEVGGNFNPQVGFLSRGGYRKPDVRIMTRFRPKRIFQELRPHVSYRGYWGFDGFQETGFAHIDNHWQFKDSTEVHTGVNLTQEGVRVPFQIYPGIFVPAGSYNNVEVQPVIMTNQGRAVSANLQTFFGGFFSGHRKTINPTVRFRAGQQLTGEVSYSRNDVDLPQGDFVTNLVRTRLSYSFTPRLFVQSLVQYNDRADVWSMNLRVGWLQAANTGLFVVYNDTRGLYDLNPTPQREDRSLVIKFSRMFDLLQ